MDAPTLVSADELKSAVQRLAGEISAAYGDGLVLVAVLKGSVPFLADMLREMTIVPEVDFMSISSYAPETGRVRIIKDLDLDVSGRDVVIVEDIVDTGLTLTYLLGELRLREAEGEHRVLPIFIGAVEATAIAFALQGVVTQRPMTHDLMRDLLMELGIGVERIVITELRDGTFYAEIEMASNGSRHTVSSRPSDAIALAARLGTPIFANEAVLDEAAVVVSDDEDEEEVEKFREFLEGVNPEDFAS